MEFVRNSRAPLFFANNTGVVMNGNHYLKGRRKEYGKRD